MRSRILIPPTSGLCCRPEPTRLRAETPSSSHYGAVVYGTFALGEALGKVQYDAWGGDRVVAADDGYLRPVKDLGIGVPSGPSGATYGGSLALVPAHSGREWSGVSETHNTLNGPLTSGFVPWDVISSKCGDPLFLWSIRAQNATSSAESIRVRLTLQRRHFPSWALIVPEDDRVWYAAATYKLSERLMVGTYHSSIFDLQDPLGPSRYQKDWVFSSRYDFNSFCMPRRRSTFLRALMSGYSTSDNPNGLKPNAKMTSHQTGHQLLTQSIEKNIPMKKLLLIFFFALGASLLSSQARAQLLIIAKPGRCKT